MKFLNVLRLPLPPKNTYEWQTQGLLRKRGDAEDTKKQGGNERGNTGEEGVGWIAARGIMGHGSKV
ncbi:MAG: hypothetical protein PVS2B2_07640 [Candidatus Acidiferrum sp.]